MEKLNKEQFKAVTHKDGPLLIVAGAGTGKTTVITQKIAYMIEQGWVKSDEILALTFTEKAAAEMEERVDRLLPIGYLDLWISTFHSFGERILREYGIEIGLPGDFRLLNEFEQYALVKKNLDCFNLDYYRPLGNPTKFIRDLIKHFSRAKDEDISPIQYLEYADGLRENLDDVFGSSKKSKSKSQKSKLFNISNFGFSNKEIAVQEIGRISEVANAYHVYQQLLLDNSVLDFGDLINYCLKLFRERPAILEKYRQQFKYILLDEFQDTNWSQYELIKMLASPKNNLTVVGDDDQSVYKFRGASVSNILQFKKDYPKAQELFLVNNYRNCQNILDLSYDFIKLNDPNRLEYELSKNNKKKLSKKLKAQDREMGVIEVIEGADLNDEIKKVIEKIAELKINDKGAAWSDFAILVRANESAKEFCNLLEVADLPHQFFSSRGLYAKPVIMDVIAYLKLLDNYHESPAMYRILNLPVFEFSYRELVNFNYFSKKKACSLFEALKSHPNIGPDLSKKINRLLALIEKHTALIRNRPVSEVVLAFVNESGFLKYLMNQEDVKAKESLELLNQFLKRIKSFESGADDKSVKAFLSELTMELEAGEQGSLPMDIDLGPDAIKVMTAHGAKGLEFKYVFISGMVDKRFPTIKKKEAISVPDDLVKESLPEGDIHLEEERRLFYVAMTRAKKNLYFSWAPDYGGVRLKKPSRFLVEVGLVNINVDKKSSAKKKEKENNLVVKTEKNHKVKSLEIEMPAFFSHTQLAAFKTCPYQYYFAHILKVPVGGKYVFSFGRAMHLALQKIFELLKEKKGLGQRALFKEKKISRVAHEKNEKIKITWEEILDIYEKNWIGDWYESKKDLEKYKAQGKKSLKEFYEKHKNNWPDILSLEQSVNLRIGGYRIYGKIDRIDDCGEKGIQIVDYKTGQSKKEGKLVIDDKEQLLIYQLAARQILDRPVCNLQFYYLNNNTEINFLGNEKDLEEMEQRILERIGNIAEAVQTGVFPPQPDPMCKYCDFKDLCEYKKL